ncbi:hypothetical protein G6F68_018555 [Rhizopus microsporus]|nr:hypothetical protein G6F68_018555 [Rhizopus microsporus]
MQLVVPRAVLPIFLDGLEMMVIGFVRKVASGDSSSGCTENCRVDSRPGSRVAPASLGLHTGSTWTPAGFWWCGELG